MCCFCEKKSFSKAVHTERKCKKGETQKLFFNLVAAIITLTLCFANFEASLH